jgi:hypothetical protein
MQPIGRRNGWIDGSDIRFHNRFFVTKYTIKTSVILFLFWAKNGFWEKADPTRRAVAKKGFFTGGRHRERLTLGGGRFSLFV